MFICLLIEKINYEDSSEREIYYIKYFNTYYSKPSMGYNKTLGGEGALGYKHSEESFAKMLQARKNRIVSEETRKKQSMTMKGRCFSKITLQKAIEKNSIAIVQITFNGEIKYWDSSKQAARELGLNSSAIRGCCETEFEEISPSYYRSFWFNRSDFESTDFKMPKRAFSNNPVVQLTLDGKFVRLWENTKEVKTEKFTADFVSKCCNGLRDYYKGFKWMYLFDYNPSLLDISNYK